MKVTDRDWDREETVELRRTRQKGKDSMKKKRER